MNQIEGLRNMVKIGEESVTKTAVKFESVRPNRLAIERYAIETAHKYGLSVPKIISYGTNDMGQEFLVMEKIIGTNAASNELNTPLEKVYQMIGEQFSQVPADFETFGWITGKNQEGGNLSWSDYITEYIVKYTSRLRDKGELDSSEATRIIDLVSKNIPELKKASLVHRDLKPLNLIVNKEKVTILDWENVMLGDPLFDLAVLSSRFPSDERLTKGFMIGLLDNACTKDQQRSVSVYGIVNLVGSICFYRGKAPRDIYNRLKDSLDNLDHSTPVAILSNKTITYPKPIPSYLRD